MAIRNLDKIFKPKSVAVIGASERPSSVGHTVVTNLVTSGFPGEVYPINPKYDSLEGLKAYPNVAALPDGADLAVICTPAKTVPRLIVECGEAGIMGLVVLTAGFREAGGEGKQLEQQMRETAVLYDGMRIVGPNCLGVLCPHQNLNASFADGMPPKGHIAFISQSGALCTSVLDWARAQNVGFSHFVSVGNMTDVNIADLIDYFSLDENTESVIMYVESLQNSREFMSAARAFARTKPIVAYKAGRFTESAQAAASHTGAMAGVDAVYEAAFARAGVVRVFESGDMFNCAELLARGRNPKGPRLAILTNAGGPGVMATDALIEHKGQLAELSEATMEKLTSFLPSSWSHNNPVDVLGDAPPERFSESLEVVLADKGVDAAVVVLTPQAMTNPTLTAELVGQVAKKSRKPILAAWMGGEAVKEGIHALDEAGVPTYESPENAVRAFMYLVKYTRSQQFLHETPKDIPVEFALDRSRLKGVFDTIFSEHTQLLTENTSKALLDAYEIPISKPYVARNRSDAVEYARRIGYPVVMKVLSEQITHKADVDGVLLNLNSDNDVRNGFDRILKSAAERRPDATVDGVTVQRMVNTAGGCELILGAKRDPVFGPVILVGAGGFTAELMQDHSMELPPLNERLARRMLESLRAWPLLTGYRSKPAVNIDALLEVLMRFSYLVADYPEIYELDINPLLVTPQEAIALDARVVLDHQAILHPVRRYSHLAIRPYPEEYVHSTTLNDGTDILLRPIRPEDEPMWHTMLAECSRESIWFRFRYVFKETDHKMATRFCFIDYDREIGIVAELEKGGERKLLGVGRLVADADHRDAEYAVLVADAYQGNGLGSVLTDYCLEICENWGVRRVVAETAPENTRMIGIFKRRGFDLDHRTAADTVLARREVTRLPKRIELAAAAPAPATAK